MKFVLIYIVTFLALLNSCKDSSGHFPVVEDFTATVMPDGKVKVECSVIPGDFPIKQVAFCMGTYHTPMVNMNSLEASESDGKFYGIYEINDHVGKYYFRAWASNEFGFTYSEIVALDSIEATLVEPPCSPPENTVDYGFISGVQSVNWVTMSEYSTVPPIWEINTSNSNGSTKFRFYGYPGAGIYTTSAYSDPDVNEIYVQFTSGSVTEHIDGGSQIYVSRYGDDTLQITICDAPYLFSSVTNYVVGSFIVPEN